MPVYAPNFSACLIGHDVITCPGSILKNSEEEFARELHLLSLELQFDIQKFEDVINRIRTCVAEVGSIDGGTRMSNRVKIVDNISKRRTCVSNFCI